MLELLSSLILTMSIPTSVITMISVVSVLRGGKFQGWKALSKDIAIGVSITFAITLACCLALRIFGVLEGQFCRPSKAEYGEVEKQARSEELWIETEQGQQIHALLFEPESEPKGTILHLHGSDANISMTVRNCAWLVDYGYQVVAIDYRGYGKSEGIASRIAASEDAVEALNHLRNSGRFSGQKFALWGQSMGGQIALLAVAKAGEQRVTTVISEATYASPKWHVKDKLSQIGPLWLLQWALWLVASDESAAVAAVGEIQDVNILFVHGDTDRAVLPYHSDWLFEQTKAVKEIWREPQRGHLDIFTLQVNRMRLVEYLDRCFDAD